ncbi:WhiB family transcriptional regulator [Streptosporangium sp. NPDC001559]|uniref:WhiB family transcriptional regulator n=1 Tax=Streptosporangium sp. NPDC001559 TaxID=3366187 RepID=UPI0036E3485B
MTAVAGIARIARLLRPPSAEWQRRAACETEDFALFFPAHKEQPEDRERRERKAKAICAQCPVRTECLNYALSRPEKYGTWGGLNEEERKNERRRLFRRSRTDAMSEGDWALYADSVQLIEIRGLPLAEAANHLDVDVITLRRVRRQGIQQAEDATPIQPKNLSRT